MKQILQTLQYVAAAVAIFMVIYFSYLVAVGLGAAMLPFFFVLALLTVLVARCSRDYTEDE